MTHELVTSQEQARLLHCSIRYLSILRKRRLIPFIKLGAAVRFNPDAVARAIEKLTIKERI